MNIVLRGYLQSSGDLLKITNPSIGDGYCVASSGGSTYYYWDGVQWGVCGSVSGQAGVHGVSGGTGPQGWCAYSRVRLGLGGIKFECFAPDGALEVFEDPLNITVDELKLLDVLYPGLTEDIKKSWTEEKVRAIVMKEGESLWGEVCGKEEP